MAGLALQFKRLCIWNSNGLSSLCEKVSVTEKTCVLDTFFIVISIKFSWITQSHLMSTVDKYSMTYNVFKLFYNFSVAQHSTK